MATVHSTRDVHPRERLSYWLEVATKTFVKHDFHSDRGPTFNATLQGGSLAGLAVATVICDPCRVDREARHIARDSSDELVVCLQSRGKMLTSQDGRDGCNEGSGVLLLDMRRPYTQVFDGETQVTGARSSVKPSS